MTKFFKALKFIFLIGAGLLLGNSLILSVFTLFDAIEWLTYGFTFPVSNIVYLLKINHQYSLGLLFAAICILSAIAIIISEKQIKKDNKNGIVLSKEERQAKILKIVKIMLFIVGGLFLVYSFCDTLLIILDLISCAIEIRYYTPEDLLAFAHTQLYEDTYAAFISLIQRSPLSCVGLLLIILGFFTGIRKKKAVSSIEQPIQTEENA